MRTCIRVLFFAALLTLIVATMSSAEPRFMNYQAELNDSTGKAIDGNRTLIFSLYEQSIGGLSKWSETQTVNVKKGQLIVKLGQLMPFPDSLFLADSLFLGILISPDLNELDPRTELTSVPAAFVAKTVPDKSIGQEKIKDKDIGQDKLKDKDIGHEKIRNNAIKDSLIENDAIGNDKIKEKTIGQEKIKDKDIGHEKLKNGAIKDSLIEDGAVKGNKLAKKSIKADHLERNGASNGQTFVWEDTSWTIGYVDDPDWVREARLIFVDSAFSLTRLGNTFWATDSSGHVNLGSSSATGSSFPANSHTTIAGGVYNKVSAGYSTVGGGYTNEARQWGSVVAGGINNEALMEFSVVSGGEENQAAGRHASVAGGTENIAAGSKAAIGGGASNLATGQNSVISGGASNTASGEHSSVMGGTGNSAIGDRSTVLGGWENFSRGHSSLTAGHWAETVDSAFGTMVFCALSDYWWGVDGITAYEPGMIVLKAERGIYITTNSPEAHSMPNAVIYSESGAHLSTSGAWNNSSDSTRKENFQAINRTDLLERLAALPIAKWNYKEDDATLTHIGPTAQGFQAAFGLGSDGKTISTIDPSGIALAAIQELHARNKQQAKTIDELTRQLDELKSVVEQLKVKK